MSERCWSLLLGLGLAACGGAASTPTVSRGTDEQRAVVREIRLATVEGPQEELEHQKSDWLIVDSDGLDREHEGRWQRLAPLGDRPRVRQVMSAQRRRVGTTLTLAIAPDIPYRTTADVLQAASEARFTSLHLVVTERRSDYPMGLEVSLPATVRSWPYPNGTTTPSDAGLGLFLHLTNEGIVVGGTGGYLAPGCRQTGASPVPTVQGDGDSYQWESLSRCLAGIKAQFSDEREVSIGADPQVTFGALARAIETAQSHRSFELFPRVHLVLTMSAQPGAVSPAVPTLSPGASRSLRSPSAGPPSVGTTSLRTVSPAVPRTAP